MDGRIRRWIVGAGVVLAIVALALRWLADTAPDSDFALIDLSVLRVLSGWQPVGVYSRFGWAHPGPLYFQLLAPLYALSGHRHSSVVLSVAAMNAASLIGLGAILQRHSAALFVGAIIWITAYLVRLDGLLASPWNPYVPLLPLLLLLVSAAAAASGRYRLLPLVVGLASFVIQTHVGFAPVALTALALTSLVIGVDVLRAGRRRDPIDRSLARGAAGALVIGCLVWAVPVIDELRPAGHHNLQRMIEYFSHATAANPRLSARAFEHLVIAPLTPGLRLWDSVPLPAHEQAARSIAQAQAVALVTAAIIFFRRRQTFERNLALIALATSLVGLEAVRRLPETPLEYTVLWVTALGALNWVVISAVPIAAVFSWVRRRRAPLLTPQSSRWLVSGLVVAVLAACARDVVVLRATDAHASSRIQRLADVVRRAAVDAHTNAPLVIVPPSFWGVATGVVLQLRLLGYSPRVDANWVPMFGDDCKPTGREPLTIAFAEFEEHSEDIRNRSNYRRLGEADSIFAYAVSPVPDSVTLAAPLTVVDHSANVVDASRASDGDLGDDTGPASAPHTVTFFGSDEFVTIEVPRARVIGVRVVGQPGSAWQLRCAKRGEDFARIGRVSVGTRTGESFLWTLDGCHLLKISPVSDQEPSWLAEVQLLAAPAAVKRP